MDYFKNVQIVRSFLSIQLKGKSCLILMIKELDSLSSGIFHYDSVRCIWSCPFFLHITLWQRRCMYWHRDADNLATAITMNNKLSLIFDIWTSCFLRISLKIQLGNTLACKLGKIPDTSQFLTILWEGWNIDRDVVFWKRKVDSFMGQLSGLKGRLGELVNKYIDQITWLTGQ